MLQISADPDVAENMERLYFRGIAGYDEDDDSLLSMLIWELKSIDSSENTESELKWIYAIDPSFIEPMLNGYSKEAQSERVIKTFFEDKSLEPENQTAFRDNGFSLNSVESRDINVTVDECRKLSIARSAVPSYVHSIERLKTEEFYQGLMNILFKYSNPALEDLAFLPKKWYEQSVSCYIKTDGKVTGYFLIHACPSGILTPVLLFAVGSDSRMSLVEMIRFTIRKAAEIYPKDTIIRIHRRNQSVSALSKKLFPDKKGDPAVAGERYEGEGF